MRIFCRLLAMVFLSFWGANGYAFAATRPTTLSLIANPTSVTTFQTTTVTATIGTMGYAVLPTGSVVLSVVGSTYQQTCYVYGNTCPFTVPAAALTPGAAQVIATYSGDIVYAGSVSAPLSVEYDDSNAPPEPIFTPAQGTYSTPQLISLSAPPGTNIYYSLNPSFPATMSSYTLYTGPFELAQGTLIGAYSTYTAAPFTTGPEVYASYGFQPAQVFGGGSGFPESVMLNGNAALTFTGFPDHVTDYLTLTRAGVVNQSSSVFSPTQYNIQGFTNDFVFRQTNSPGTDPDADGLMFVIQNQGPSALGAYGEGLGYGSGPGNAGISTSVGIKFDIYDNAGEGNNSTGLFTSGAVPTVPAIDLTPSGVNLHSGHSFSVHMTYDGTTLTVTTTDVSEPRNTATQSYMVDIPTLVGGTSAYVGFTAGTGGLASSQTVGSWQFASGAPVGTPVFSPSPSAVTQYVSITDLAPYAQLYYTVDGSNPDSEAILYSGPIAIQGVTTLRAVAYQIGEYSAVASGTFTSPQPYSVNLPNGFAGSGMILNGSATLNQSKLELTKSGVVNQAASAYYPTPVNVQTFTTDFDFQITNPDANLADGFMFVLQNQGTKALGAFGESLGYGVPGGAGIQPSAGIKFDLYNNAGEGANSTGLYMNGTVPTIPAMDLTSTGIDLHSGHVFHVHITGLPETAYPNPGTQTLLQIKITDQTTQAVASSLYNVDLVGLLGGPTAYAGFTGGTGGFAATQDILNWTYAVP